MSNRTNLDIVKDLYSAFGTGDLPRLLGLLDSGVSWAVPGSAPWSGEGQGHAHVQRFFQSFGARAALEKFEPRSFLADGDQVVVTGYEEGTARDTGRAWKAHFTHVFRLAQGKVTAHREYVDTQAIAQAFGA
jgi:uncharacterized protein